jgi:hypothetical protein
MDLTPPICDEEAPFLRQELRKLHTAALECIIGHTWGIQRYAFDILIEREDWVSMFPRGESGFHRNTGEQQSMIAGIYVRKQDSKE